MSQPEPSFFATPAEFRDWLRQNHDSAGELWVGFHKKRTGRPSITWPESVDQALCFGWIDGIRKSVDAHSYKIRFTPRRRGSIWSAVNVRRATELIELGLMEPAGARAFAEYSPEKSARYSFERKDPALPPALEQRFRRNRKAWKFFQAQPPGYRKTLTWWVVSAKKDETREKRLEKLIAESEASRRVI